MHRGAWREGAGGCPWEGAGLPRSGGLIRHAHTLGSGHAVARRATVRAGMRSDLMSGLVRNN